MGSDDLCGCLCNKLGRPAVQLTWCAEEAAASVRLLRTPVSSHRCADLPLPLAFGLGTGGMFEQRVLFEPLNTLPPRFVGFTA